ncbi:ABC transporter permease [Accumulibacter sp.]|uniref:ABC transporter permease n=1 Tax=Accumulibacter sp. TaxID=2053492 RepID=UPI002612ADF9|nr:ABC transporter permease [Accumulibacter sp.]
MRSPLSITFSVWKAIFLREAIDRLFDMRAAWFWLLMEPVFHIGFIVFIFTVVRIRTISGIDVALWIIVGMLSFFLFRRTALQVMYAVDSNQPLFAYRQVKPVDTALVRGGLEAFLMAIISTVVLIIATLLGHATLPDNPLLVLQGLGWLWFIGLGYGLVASVLMVLGPELEHILKMLMMPLYLISGVIFPIAAVPNPYRDLLLMNPIAHGLEAVRSGFSAYYHVAPELSMSYLSGFALVGTFLGLALHRRYSLRLVTK